MHCAEAACPSRERFLAGARSPSCTRRHEFLSLNVLFIATCFTNVKGSLESLCRPPCWGTSRCSGSIYEPFFGGASAWVQRNTAVATLMGNSGASFSIVLSMCFVVRRYTHPFTYFFLPFWWFVSLACWLLPSAKDCNGLRATCTCCWACCYEYERNFCFGCILPRFVDKRKCKRKLTRS